LRGAPRERGLGVVVGLKGGVFAENGAEMEVVLGVDSGLRRNDSTGWAVDRVVDIREGMKFMRVGMRSLFRYFGCS
ncbi:MAG TPA: hypothetical protein VLL52_18480, partial [Anaerolineae bacterium]|nr:hypothetical protein [Anaerolineae bacterium]